MPSAEIITVGTEMLLGQLVDTNTAVIAADLAAIGVDVYRETSVGDNTDRIASAVTEAAARADIVLCAGGLGPTVDDLTRDGIAQATGRRLTLDHESLRGIEEIFAKMGRTMSENNRRQALFPAGATIIDNRNGSAPGFIVEHGDHVIAAMPGPPRELTPMLRHSIIPWLVRRFSLHSAIVTRVLHTTGVPESEIDARIADLFRSGVNPSIAVLAHIGLVDVKITAKAEDRATANALIAKLEPAVRERLGDCVFGTGDETLPSSLGDALRARGWSIATAESCTGGLVAASITSVPGASVYFRGGVVAYADEVKLRLLGVDQALLAEHGAVSEQTAIAMASGARDRFHADLAVSVTGIAGPDGGTPEKPVGLVYLGLASPEEQPLSRGLLLPGDREGIQRRATLAALNWAWRAARKDKRE
ncbi:MAG TPA: competence/damage-inducible protein A [Candidatus Eremiobacteraceae bacterium]|nr:competence/damage-inducible protein A [Candidatus Eremiobacteraceae bacterium]